MPKVIIFFIFITTLVSCKNEPTKQSLVGKYEVQVELKDKEEIKNKIKDEMGKAADDVKIDIQTSKENIKDEIDLASTDTTTTEGKIEYAAQLMAKEMAESGLELGKAAGKMTKSMGAMASGLFDGIENILSDQRFDVELQEDGDVKLPGMVSIFAPNVTWAVEGNTLIIKRSNDADQRLEIVSHDASGFVCTVDKVRIIAKRKKE
jgi:5-hydroxyisourate hydrolase-like protein (transthyretin family)